VYAGESISVQTWNNPQGGQVHYTDAAAGASDDGGWSSAPWFIYMLRIICNTLLT